MINVEDMKVLAEYEGTFHTAIESGYARHFGSRSYAALNEIFKRITGKYYSVNYGCSYCALGFIKAIGKLYFEEKQRLEAEADKCASPEISQQDVEDLIEVIEAAQDEPQPKEVTASKPASKSTSAKSKATNKKQNKK